MTMANNDDIPGGIPEDERAEFLRRRAVKISELKKNAASPLEDFIRRETLIAIWRASVLGGSPSLVKASLSDGFTPDTPLDDDGLAPLVSIARAIPKSRDEAAALADTARCLIEHGATLNLRDRCGLLPADHALFSPSAAIAREITLATLRQNIQRQTGRYFRPNYRAVFATLAYKKAVNDAHSSLLNNIEIVRYGIQKATLQGDTQLQLLPVREREYWDRLSIPDAALLPEPTTELVEAYQSVMSQKEAKSLGFAIKKEQIEAAEDRARLLETAYCQTFKPDYT